MRRTLVALTLLVATGVLAAGCGGNSSGSGGDGAGGGSLTTTAASTATGSGGRGAYGGRPPAVLAPLRAGPRWPSTTLRFTGDPEGQGGPAGYLDQQSKQGVGHTVTANGGAFNQPMPSGATFSFTLTKAGAFAYHCTIHPSMGGKIVVS